MEPKTSVQVITPDLADLVNSAEQLDIYIASLRGILKHEGCGDVVSCETCPFMNTSDIWDSTCLLSTLVSPMTNIYKFPQDGLDIIETTLKTLIKKRQSLVDAPQDKPQEQ